MPDKADRARGEQKRCQCRWGARSVRDEHAVVQLPRDSYKEIWAGHRGNPRALRRTDRRGSEEDRGVQRVVSPAPSATLAVQDGGAVSLFFLTLQNEDRRGL